MGIRKNGRVRRRHAREELAPSPCACLPRAPVLSFAHYFQAPATPAILKMSTIGESNRVSGRGLINGTGFPVILVGTAKKNILEFPFHLRNFFTRTSCSIWSLQQNSWSFGTILWWTFLLKVLSIYHKWLITDVHVLMPQLLANIAGSSTILVFISPNFFLWAVCSVFFLLFCLELMELLYPLSLCNLFVR